MPAKKLSELRPIEAIDRSEVYEVFGRADGLCEVSLALAVIRPNSKTVKHRHSFLEIYVVESGRGRIHVDNESYEASPGLCVLIPPGAAHWAEAYAEGLSIWCICSPAFSESGTELDAD